LELYGGKPVKDPDKSHDASSEKWAGTFSRLDGLNLRGRRGERHKKSDSQQEVKVVDPSWSSTFIILQTDGFFYELKGKRGEPLFLG